MERIRRTIDLAKASLEVLKKDRELLLLPVLGFVGALVIMAIVAVPMWASVETTTGLDGVETTEASPMTAVLGLVATLAISVVTIFFNGALVAGAYERMSGGDPTVSSSINRAFNRISGLVPWALLTATVGLVLQALRERAGFLGRIVVGFIGAAWDIASYLVVPAIIIDDKSAVEGLKTSGSLIKQTWGEGLAARIGFGLLAFALMIPGALVAVAGIATGILVVQVITVVAAVVWIAFTAVLITALGAVFQTALYLYATTGEIPADFRTTALPQAFQPK